MREREAFQELDYRAVFGSMATSTTEIDTPDRIPELVARAFGCAKSSIAIKTGAGSKLKRVVVPD